VLFPSRRNQALRSSRTGLWSKERWLPEGKKRSDCTLRRKGRKKTPIHLRKKKKKEDTPPTDLSPENQRTIRLTQVEWQKEGMECTLPRTSPRGGEEKERKRWDRKHLVPEPGQSPKVSEPRLTKERRGFKLPCIYYRGGKKEKMGRSSEVRKRKKRIELCALYITTANSLGKRKSEANLLGKRKKGENDVEIAFQEEGTGFHYIPQ